MIIEQLEMFIMTNKVESIEYKISDYLLNNYQNIINEKQNNILKKIGVSKSTMNRFCKMLGYKNFTEVSFQLFFEESKQVQYHPNIKTYTLSKEYLNVFKNKKRIILLGDSISLSSLTFYKHVFRNINIDLCIHITGEATLELMKDYNICDEDIIVHISLFKTNLQLEIDYYHKYNDIKTYAYNNHVSFIYMGLNENEDNVIEIEKNNMGDMIKDLCDIFDQIYMYLRKI